MNWIKRAFHRMGSPRFFYEGSRNWVIALFVFGIASVALGTVWGLFYAPVERYQGETYRSLYVHAPAAHLAQMIYIAIENMESMSCQDGSCGIYFRNITLLSFVFKNS